MPEAQKSQVTRRIYVSVDDDDFEKLEQEAEKRRIPVAVLIRSLVGEAVDNLFIKI